MSSLIKQINEDTNTKLARDQMIKISEQTAKLLSIAKKDPDFAAELHAKNKKAVKEMLEDMMGRIGDDPSDDHIVVAAAMSRLF